jgi:hypothetical protein
MSNKKYRVVEHIYQDPYTVVKIEYPVSIVLGSKELYPERKSVLSEFEILGVGFAKRNEHDGDIPHPNIGFRRAYQRAIEDAKKQVKALQDDIKVTIKYPA